MSVGYNKKRKRNRKALFAAFPELRQVYWLIRNGKVPRWFLSKLPSGNIRMRKAGGNKIYQHPWIMQSTFGKELRDAILKSRKAT